MKNGKALIRALVPVVVLMLLGLVVLIVSGGCKKSAGAIGDPKEVVVAFFEDLYEGDYGSAMPYCTDRCMRQVLDDGGLAFNKVRDDHASGGNIYTMSKLVSHVKGTNTCEIYSEEDEELRIWLVVDHGKWMIDEFQYRRPEARDRDREADEEEDEGQDEGDEEEEDGDDRNIRERD